MNVTKMVSWLLAVFFLVLKVKCYDPKPHQKLFEITTVDERGEVRAQVVAQTLPTTDRNIRQAESKPTSDDEDSTSDDQEGSGGESDKLRVVNDEAVVPASSTTASVSLLNSITPSSTMRNAIVTVTSEANNSSVASAPMSTQPSIITVTPRSSAAVILTSIASTNLNGSTITITQIESSSSFTASLTTVAPLLDVKTDSTTTAAKSSTTVSTIQTTNVWNEITPTVTTAAPTKILQSTTRSTETDHEVESTTAIVTEVTDIKSVYSTPTPNVIAHHDPTEKPRERKTLFGFVTVEILIALLAGALFSVLLVAFLVYRLKKRNEGSYELSETIALRPKELDEMGTKKEVFV